MWKFLAVLLGAALPSISVASQEGRVLTGGAQIHALPDHDSPVIGSLEAGDAVRMSDYPKDGWFRVLMQAGKTGDGPVDSSSEKKDFGWIHVDTVAPINTLLEFKENGVQYQKTPSGEGGRHLFVFTAIYNAAFARPRRLQNAIGAAEVFFPSHRYGAELGLRFTYRFSFLIHGALWQGKQKFNQGTITASGTDVAALFDYTVVHHLPFKWGIAIGGGQSLNAKAVAAAGSESISATKSALLGIGKTYFRGYMSDHFALELELGYRYLRPFSSSSGTQVNLSSPLAGIGLLAEF